MFSPCLPLSRGVAGLPGLSAGVEGVHDRSSPPLPSVLGIELLHASWTLCHRPAPQHLWSFLKCTGTYFGRAQLLMSLTHLSHSQLGHRSLEAFHLLCRGGWCSLFSRPFLLKCIEHLTFFFYFLQSFELDFLVQR